MNTSTANPLPRMRATTILAVRREGRVAIGGDGQVTVGETVMKSHAQKVRLIHGGKIVAGFAGAAADAMTLFEKFEEKLERFPGIYDGAAVRRQGRAAPPAVRRASARAVMRKDASARRGSPRCSPKPG